MENDIQKMSYKALVYDALAVINLNGWWEIIENVVEMESSIIVQIVQFIRHSIM